MAVLTDGDRKKIWSRYMSEASSDETAIPLNKSDLRAIVDAIDTWISDNMASFNSSLPLPGRTRLTGKEKVRLFLYVVNQRWEVE